MVSKKYRKSPIVEAICEFRFEEDSPWDMAIPGLVYEKVRNSFPIRRQAAQVAIGFSGSQEGIVPQFGTVPIMQFLRTDEKALIQVGAHLLSVSVLKPYPSWQRFMPLIRKGFEAYCDVADPKRIRRIGLRYINHIEIPSQNIKLEDYFEFRPYVGSGLPQDFGTFVVGIQIPYEENRDTLSLQLTSLPIPGLQTDKAIIVLSLDYFLLKPGEVALEEAFKWIETAHLHIGDVFEACITENLRALFKGVKK